MTDFWTVERCNTLRHEWGQKLPVRKIADILGASKNAVIGKARRLNLPMHPDSFLSPEFQRVPDKPRAVLPRRNRRSPFKIVGATKAIKVPPQAPDALNIAFDDLDNHHCRYATTANAPFLFCGSPKEGDSSYCAFHHALCHEKARGREDRTRKPYLNPFRRAA